MAVSQIHDLKLNNRNNKVSSVKSMDKNEFSDKLKNSSGMLMVKKNVTKYSPSQRINSLALPVIRPVNNNVIDPYAISRSALTARASNRIIELARSKPDYSFSPKANPYSISPEAKLAAVSPRIHELAQPLARHNNLNDHRENPFEVSLAALNATASERLSELAKPRMRNVTAKYVSPEELWQREQRRRKIFQRSVFSQLNKSKIQKRRR